jgi:hypothetical protein
MSNLTNRKTISKSKGKKVSKTHRKPLESKGGKLSQKKYFYHLLLECQKLKTQKLKELLELESIHNTLTGLLEKNPHLKISISTKK